MRMQVDAFGKIENCLDHHIDKVDMEKDLSNVVYDNYASKKRFGQDSSQYDRSNYSQSNYSQSNYGGSYQGGNQRHGGGYQGNNQRHGGDYQGGNQRQGGQFRDDRTNNYSSMNDVASVNTFLSSQIAK